MLDVIPSCLNTISLLHISPFSLKYKQIKKSVYACVDVCVFLMFFKAYDNVPCNTCTSKST